MLNKFAELKKRLLFLAGAILVFRIGAHIPIPGIDPFALSKLFASSQTGLLDMVNMFSGGALSRFTIFSLGIMPYISASIVMQLSSEVFPYLIALKKDGDIGRKKISKYTRYATVLLSLIQSFGVSAMLYRQPGLVTISHTEFLFTSILCLITGTMFLMWLGEQITERGIGNGISMIIATGIVSGIPNAITKTLSLVSQGSLSIFTIILVLFIIALITYIVVLVERSQRKIPIQYAKRPVGNRMMQAQTSHLPLKINMAGVIPPIFASSGVLFIATVFGWVSHGNEILSGISDALRPGQPLYIVVYVTAIIFFCFFYTALVFNPKDTSDNLKKSGAVIPGVRPGENTAKYIEKIILRLTLAGAIYISAICLLPELFILQWHIPFYFGGTSLLIIVVVSMDFMTQIQSLTMSLQYDSLLKKANLRGF